MISVSNTLHIGRGPHNQVVLDTPDVSWSHALLRLEGDVLVAEDLGSKNGTWVDGIRITRPTVVNTNLKVGDYVGTLRAQMLKPVLPSILLEEVDTDVRYPLGNQVFVIGDTPDANVHVPGAKPERIEVDGLQVRLDGKLLTLPWQGLIAGMRMRLVSNVGRWTPTKSEISLPLPKIKVSLQPPVAEVVDLDPAYHHAVTAPNRVSFLYFLARCRTEDRSNSVPTDQQGWRRDEDVAVAIWGRTARGGPRNRLNTLTYRLRTELQESGVMSDLIDKKAGWVRLADCEIELA